MALLRFVCFLLIIANFARCFVILDDPNSNFAQWLGDISKEVFEKDCDTQKNVTDIVETAVECAFNYLPKDIEELREKRKQSSVSQICQNVQEAKKFMDCFDGFMELVQECQPSAAEKLSKEVLSEAMDQLIDFVCRPPPLRPGFNVLYEDGTIQCLTHVRLTSLKTCFSSGNFLSKTAVCGSASGFSNCFNGLLTHAHCRSAQPLRNFVEEVSTVVNRAVCVAPTVPRLLPTPVQQPVSTARPVRVPKPVPNLLPVDFSSHIYYENPFEKLGRTLNNLFSGPAPTPVIVPFALPMPAFAIGR